jgi:hypothetical protein
MTHDARIQTLIHALFDAMHEGREAGPRLVSLLQQHFAEVALEEREPLEKEIARLRREIEDALYTDPALDAPDGPEYQAQVAELQYGRPESEEA